MGRKRSLEQGCEVERAEQVERVEQAERAEQVEGRPEFNDLLVNRVLDQLDLASIASKLAPDLAGRLVGSIRLDVLGDRVFEKLVDRLANDPIIAEAVVGQLLARLRDGRIVGESPRS